MERFRVEVHKNDKLDASKLSKWQREANKWQVTVSYKGRSMTINYFTGQGYKGNPVAYDVLYSLFSDALTAETTNDVADFLIDLGYCDSVELIREGTKVFKAVKKEARQFKKLLGEDYDYLMDAFIKDEDMIEQLAKEAETVYIA